MSCRRGVIIICPNSGWLLLTGSQSYRHSLSIPLESIAEESDWSLHPRRQLQRPPPRRSQTEAALISSSITRAQAPNVMPVVTRCLASGSHVASGLTEDLISRRPWSGARPSFSNANSLMRLSSSRLSSSTSSTFQAGLSYSSFLKLGHSPSSRTLESLLAAGGLRPQLHQPLP